LILANAASAVATNYFVWDDWGGTWADAEKVLPDDGVGNPSGNPGGQDDWMCWAATASNILEWTGWHGPGGLTNADAIFKYYQDHWTDYGLSNFDHGSPWKWWFDGISVSPGETQVDVPGGGFFPTADFHDYYHEEWDNPKVMSAVDEFLRAGYGTTLSVGWWLSPRHEVTVWGFEYDETAPNYYTGIWITDSDDDCDNPPYPDRLRYYPVKFSSANGGNWYVPWVDGSEPLESDYLTDARALGRNPDCAVIPAPAAILLAALGTCAVPWLRRRGTL